MTGETIKEKEKAKDEIETDVRTLSIKKSKISMTGFKSKKPAEFAKEEKRQKEFAEKRIVNRIAKAKADAKMKPIDKRRAVLAARFKAVKARKRTSTYSNKNIEAWLEEYNLIQNNPKSWNRITAKGTRPFQPGNKKKKTAKDILDEMDLE